MTPRNPYQVDAVSNRLLQPKPPKNTLNWLAGVSESMKIEPKQTSGPLLHQDIPHKNMIIRYYKGSDNPKDSIPS